MEARGTFSRYALVRKIASGGMATVYFGRASGPEGLERPVAIKVCHPHLVDVVRKAALVDEARVAARIRHPNVVETFDAVERDDTVWIVMEHVDGSTVAGLLRNGALPFDVALRIAFDTLAGLAAVHAADVVHRDVSPQNILVGKDGYTKLADFGVFKGKGRIAPSTETGDLKGKLGYVAPEVYRGEPITPRVDLYAMGVVLWEMLAGRRLFEEDTHAAMMHRALRGWVPSLADVGEGVPAEIDGVLARALAPDPADRFASAEDFAAALETIATNAGVKAVARHALGERVAAAMPASVLDAVEHDSLTPNEYETPVSVPRPRSSRAVSIAVAASLVAALVGTVVFATRRPPAPPALPSSPAAPVLAPASTQTTTATPTIAVSALPPASAPKAKASVNVKPRIKPPAAKSPVFDPAEP